MLRCPFQNSFQPVWSVCMFRRRTVWKWNLVQAKQPVVLNLLPSIPELRGKCFYLQPSRDEFPPFRWSACLPNVTKETDAWLLHCLQVVVEKRGQCRSAETAAVQECRFECSSWRQAWFSRSRPCALSVGERERPSTPSCAARPVMEWRSSRSARFWRCTLTKVSQGW